MASRVLNERLLADRTVGVKQKRQAYAQGDGKGGVTVEHVFVHVPMVAIYFLPLIVRPRSHLRYFLKQNLFLCGQVLRS